MSLTRSNVTLADLGPYSVRVDNSFGTITSAPAPLSPSPLSNARMEWYTVDGGGGPSSNSQPSTINYQLSGTIGQPDAGKLSGGIATMQGGFWNGLIGNRPPIAGSPRFTRMANSTLTIPISSLLTNATDPDGDILSLKTVSSPSTNGATVGMYSNSVIYTPPYPDTNAPDRFYFTVTDPFGGEATGALLISVTNTLITPPTISAIHVLSDGSIEIDLAGSPNQAYYVQAASNLSPPIIWVNIATNHADTGGALHYFDSGATNFPTRFYRFVTP
jgi:hypothetical protein